MYKHKYEKYKNKYLDLTTPINIHNIYMTYDDDERIVFYNIFTDMLKYNSNNNITVIHFRFNKTDIVDNIEYIDNPLDAEIITIKGNKLMIKQTKIKSLQNIIDIYKENTTYDRNVFVYSGHSDGLYLIHKKIFLLSLKNFTEIIKKSIGKKADLIIGDACLLGNISSLNTCKDAAKYMISSPGYYGYTSMLSMKSLYKFPGHGKHKLIRYGEKLIDEYIDNIKVSANIILYKLHNQDLLDIINVMKQYKDKLRHYVCAINKQDYYYIDVECGLIDIGYQDFVSFQNKLDNIVKYHRYKRINESKISRLLIILKKPNKYKRESCDVFYCR